MGNYNQLAPQPVPPEEDDPVLVGIATHEVLAHPLVLMPLEMQLIAAMSGVLVEAAINAAELAD